MKKVLFGTFIGLFVVSLMFLPIGQAFAAEPAKDAIKTEPKKEEVKKEEPKKAEEPAKDAKKEEVKKEEPKKAEEPKKDDAKKDAGVKLSTGVYNCEVPDVDLTDYGLKGSGTIKMQLDLQDSAFTIDYFVTTQEVSEVLIYKSRGKWKQEGEAWILTDQLEQVYNAESGTLSAWAPPEGGKPIESIKISDITKNTFREYDEKLKKWYTWSKP